MSPADVIFRKFRNFLLSTVMKSVLQPIRPSNCRRKFKLDRFYIVVVTLFVCSIGPFLMQHRDKASL